MGIIQEGGVFMLLHISGRKSSSNGLHRYCNDRTCVLRVELQLDFCSFKNNSGVQWTSSLTYVLSTLGVSKESIRKIFYTHRGKYMLE